MSTKVFYKDNNLYILNGNILTDTKIPNNYIDLIVTSPPYNLSKEYEISNDNLEYSEYLEFSCKWLQKCYTLAKDDGRLCINIPIDTGKGAHRSTGADITCIAKNIGWNYRTTIVWNEGNISNSMAKGSFMSASSPHVISPVELIVVFYKKQWKKLNTGKSDITKDEFLEWTNGLWTFNGESKRKIGHPAPFPLELPKRCIKLFSYINDIVLDPFMGSGTTPIAAKMLSRKTIGVDISEDYCKLAYKRIFSKL